MLALSLTYLGEAALTLGYTDIADQSFSEAQTCSAQIHNGLMEVAALTGLAAVAVTQAAWADAVAYARQAVTRSNEVGEIWSSARAHVVLGDAAQGSGDPTTARQMYTEALHISLTNELLPTAIAAWVGLANLDLQTDANRPDALIVLALVLTHAATSRRTAARATDLWDRLATQVDTATLARAERSARRLEPAQLAPLLRI